MTQVKIYWVNYSKTPENSEFDQHLTSVSLEFREANYSALSQGDYNDRLSTNKTMAQRFYR